MLDLRSEDEASKRAPVFRSARMLVESTVGQLESVQSEQKAPLLNGGDTSKPKVSSSMEIPDNLGWTDPTLTMLGLYHPLSPCHVRVKKDRLRSILKRLPKLFRKLSLKVEYHNSPVSASCESMNQVEFQVLFFAGREGTEDEDSIIVEVQHCDGDTYSYHEYAQKVVQMLSTSDNGDDSEDSEGHSRLTTSAPCFWNGTLLRQADTIMQQPFVHSDKSCISDALETAWSFLSTDRYDVQRLGMESLLHMTDPNRSGLSVAVPTTLCLLFPQTETQERISRGILQLACQDDNTTEISHMALVVVTQAFQVAAESRSMDISTFLQTNHTKNGNLKLVECMLQKVSGMHHHPHRAYFAMQSLVALCRCFPALRLQIIYFNHQRQNNALGGVLEAAQIFGDSHHLALATASQQLILCLQQA